MLVNRRSQRVNLLRTWLFLDKFVLFLLIHALRRNTNLNVFFLPIRNWPKLERSTQRVSKQLRRSNKASYWVRVRHQNKT